jgi:hypothetical protein
MVVFLDGVVHFRCLETSSHICLLNDPKWDSIFFNSVKLQKYANDKEEVKKSRFTHKKASSLALDRK